MLIALASDHNGAALKNRLRLTLSSPLLHFLDLGPFTDKTVDYTTYADLVGHVVGNGECDRGVLICGTGVGMSIAANKVKGCRAALVHNLLTASKSREHNSSNVLCLGAWAAEDEENIAFAREWLSADFGYGRHVRRVEMIEPGKNGMVFANGVFDLLHQGHVEMLRWAKALGSWLVVGINSDASVKRLKGETRPLTPEWQRKKVLESLRDVDEVVIFDAEKPTQIIEEIRPSLVVKGAEWTAEEVRQRDGIPAWCAVKVFPLMQGFSTTNVIERAQLKSITAREYVDLAKLARVSQ